MAEATLSRDVALNVLGDIEAYRANLAKLPGVTEKAASAAALKMQQIFSKSAVKHFQAEEKAAKQTADTWRKTYDMLAAYAGSKIVTALASAVVGVKNEVSELQMSVAKLSQGTGIGLETVNALRFAAGATGASLNDLESAFTGFPKRLDDFGRGTGEATVALEMLGFKSQHADEMLADMDGTTREIISRLQAVEDPAKQAALATALFGDAGVKLNAILGDKSIDEWVAAAETGVEVTERSVAAAKDWTATMSLLSESFVKAKDDGSSLLDLNEVAKIVGYGFVTMSSFVVGSLDALFARLSMTMAGFRALSTGEFQLATDAFTEVTEMGAIAWLDIGSAAMEAGDKFVDAANGLGSVTAASGVAVIAFDRTTEQLKKETEALEKAKKAAAEYAKQLEQDAKLRQQAVAEYYKQEENKKKATEDFRDFVLSQYDDIATEDRIARQDAIDAYRRVAEAAEEGTITYQQASEARLAIAERERRTLQSIDQQRADDITEARDIANEAEAERKAADVVAEQEMYQTKLGFASEYAAAVMSITDSVTVAFINAQRKEIEAATNRNARLKDRRIKLEAQLALIDDAGKEHKIQNDIAAVDGAIAENNREIKEAKKKAKDLAIAQRALALFGIAVQTSLAVMQAYAMFGPPPSPVGIGASIAAGVAGTASLVAVAAQPLPTFFGGTARVPGEVNATLHDGEAVLNKGATDTLGPQIIDALNAGLSPLQAMSGGGQGDIYLDGQRVGAVMAKEVRGTGPLGKATHGNKPFGYSSPYGRN